MAKTAQELNQLVQEQRLADIYGPDGKRLIPFYDRKNAEAYLREQWSTTTPDLAKHYATMIPVASAVQASRKAANGAAITYGVSGILVGVLGTWGFKKLFGKKKGKK